MSNYAIITDGIVSNIVVWDGEGDIFSNQETVKIIEGMSVNIGDAYISGVFITKPRDGYDYDFDAKSSQWIMTEESQKIKEANQINSAKSQKATLLSLAMDKISLWQTEQSLGIISDTDKESLLKWISYIKELNAVDTSTAPNITWPTSPDDESTTSSSTATTTGDATTS